ncbi:MAG: hypothetical protein J6B53_04925 [Clostridia bacterium]|nr:hypothetical protein [Clostridia bacterium]
MTDDDFARPDLGCLLKVLNHRETGIKEMLADPQCRSGDGETALLANDIAKLGLEIIIDEGGRTDMCKAMEEHTKKIKVIESVETAMAFAKDDKEVIKFVTGKHAVTPEYVIEIMKNLAETGTAAGNREALDSERG